MTNILKTEIIDIEYTQKDEKEVRKIQEAIEKNSLFFKDLTRPHTKISFLNEPNTIQVSSYNDFKEYIKTKLPSFLKDLQEALSKTNEMNDIVYLKFIMLDKLDSLKNYSPAFAEREDLHLYVNSMYSLLAAGHYDNIDDLVNFILELPDQEKDKLLTSSLDKNRFGLLNHLLEEQIQLMIQSDDPDTEYDSFLRNHMPEILSIGQQDFMQGNILIPSEEEGKYNFPKLSRIELMQLCREFLIKIDPSLKWLKIFNEALEQNRIVFGKIYPEDHIEWCCTPYNGQRCIAAPLSGDVRDFRRMMHEFAHYVSLYNVPVDYIPAPTLDEYPSIVLETLAINFLKTKGYSDEVIEELIKERVLWTQDNIFDITPTLGYLNEYVTNGPITFEKEQQKNAHLQSFIDNGLDEDLKYKVTQVVQTDDESIKAKCDFEIMTILFAPTFILDEYPYVLGRYLSTKTLERLKEDPMLIYTLLEITENLQNETPQSVIKKMGLSDEVFSSCKEYKKELE